MVSQELVDFINEELPSNGEWWNESSKDKFHKIAGQLLSYGIKVEQIKEILTDLYTAVAEEFDG